jgi:Fe-S-cluster containining protein
LRYEFVIVDIVENTVPKGSFYAEGLRFSCTRCSACCRFDPGYVFLSKEDAEGLAAFLKIAYTDFVEKYCRWIPYGGGISRLSLKETSNYDCVFWKEGCSVYDARPLQCRTFPFWPGNLVSEKTWAKVAASCPGMDRGELHEVEYIEDALARERARRVISRSR